MVLAGVGTGSGAKETDLTRVCCGVEVVATVESPLVCKVVEVARLLEGADVVVFVVKGGGGTLGIIRDRPLLSAKLEVFVVELADGKEGRLPERVDDKRKPDKAVVEASFELAALPETGVA